jgi:hypothetical protein
MEIKMIIMTCKGREHLANRLKEQLPNAIINYDNFTNVGKMTTTAWFNYVRGWKLAGDEACLQMDDDIELCDDFENKIKEAINKYPDNVIQFFSMRKKDLTEGTRFESGRTFMMQQCYYLPKGVAKGIVEFSKKFYDYTLEKNCPTDHCIADYMTSNKMKYVIWIPNLVNHLEEKSAIDKRRSSKRQSLTFKKQ